MDMEQMLQLNRVTKPIKQGEKIIILELTDIQLHMKSRPTKSIGGAVQRSIEHNQPGRVFSPLKMASGTKSNELTVQLPFAANDPKLQEAVRQYQQQGYRVMLKVPHNLPIKLGKDATEFLGSKNGKRLLRGMEKKHKA